MRLHRFYVHPEEHKLAHKLWLRDERIIPQWQKVLRYRPGQEVVLFDGLEHERLYKIVEFDKDAAHLEYIADFERKLPKKDIYLAWALLKKDKNDWVLQKCTELGINHFVPLLTKRCEKTGFNEERAKKIVIEASEQCGRGNIPNIREPMNPSTLIKELKGKVPILVCEQTGINQIDTNLQKCVLMIGPEGGWSENELQLFDAQDVTKINLGDFTHRAETASIVAASKLL
jgi:16S rRNA (uracil1498-N3)-methyltransferase